MLLGGLVWGWYLLLLRYPSWFLSTAHECGTTCSSLSPSHSVAPHPPPLPTSLSLLPIWRNISSLNLLLLVFHTAQFSDSSGWYLFCSLDEIFSVVMQGKKCVYLSLHLDWKSQSYSFLTGGKNYISWEHLHFSNYSVLYSSGFVCSFLMFQKVFSWIPWYVYFCRLIRVYT